jgi:DNA-directed RNA polymerase subunit B'
MAQKGTAGKITPQEDMMFEESTGLTPDIIVNTTVIPSRMTISYLMELITGKAAAMFGETVNASAFQQVDLEKYKEMLRFVGFNPEGYSKMRDGTTGELIETEIYNGVVYFTALKHQPEDKINVRSIGPITSLTHQPNKGRQHGGGLRFGGMEVDTGLSHGASGMIRERLCEVSDKYKIPICKPCGTIVVYNEIEKKFYCPICDISDAGVLTIPYAKKYENHLLYPFGIKSGYVIGKNTVEEVIEEKEEDTEEDTDETEEENELSMEESEEEEELDEDVDAVEFSEEF